MKLKVWAAAAALVFAFQGLSAIAQTTAIISPQTQKQFVPPERLVTVYSRLKNADQMMNGSVLSSDGDLQNQAKAMAPDDLRREILTLVDKCLQEHSAAHKDQRAEAFGYIKNAELRLIYDREEPQSGHTTYARHEPAKAANEIRTYTSRIKDALR